jgi:hypothetical protein
MIAKRARSRNAVVVDYGRLEFHSVGSEDEFLGQAQIKWIVFLSNLFRDSSFVDCSYTIGSGLLIYLTKFAHKEHSVGRHKVGLVVPENPIYTWNRFP